MAAILGGDTHITRELGIPLINLLFQAKGRQSVNTLSLFYMAACDLIYFGTVILKTMNLRGYQEHSGHIGKGYPYR